MELLEREWRYRSSQKVVVQCTVSLANSFLHVVRADNVITYGFVIAAKYYLKFKQRYYKG